MVSLAIVYAVGIILMMLAMIKFEMEVSTPIDYKELPETEKLKIVGNMWADIRHDLPMMFIAGCIWPYFFVRITIDFINLKRSK